MKTCWMRTPPLFQTQLPLKKFPTPLAGKIEQFLWPYGPPDLHQRSLDNMLHNKYLMVLLMGPWPYFFTETCLHYLADKLN